MSQPVRSYPLPPFIRFLLVGFAVVVLALLAIHVITDNTDR